MLTRPLIDVKLKCLVDTQWGIFSYIWNERERQHLYVVHVQDLWEKAKDAGDMGDQDAATRLANLCAASALPSAVCGCCCKCATHHSAWHSMQCLWLMLKVKLFLHYRQRSVEALMPVACCQMHMLNLRDSTVPRLRVLALVLLLQTDLVSRQGAPP